MKPTAIKARWASRLMRSKDFIVITDDKAVIYADHTKPHSYADYASAHQRLVTLANFQTALNKTVRDFERGLAKQYGSPRGRKINVKVVK